ncbi:hypothetical protein [Emticicia sp. C21]|nr:hypothetical protein [Emticicia sp. C21]
MKKQELHESQFLQFMLPLLIVGGAIAIFKAGYSTGQWLFVVLH